LTTAAVEPITSSIEALGREVDEDDGMKIYCAATLHNTVKRVTAALG
jgi:hypothetical protein